MIEFQNQPYRIIFLRCPPKCFYILNQAHVSSGRLKKYVIVHVFEKKYVFGNEEASFENVPCESETRSEEESDNSEGECDESESDNCSEESESSTSLNRKYSPSARTSNVIFKNIHATQVKNK